MSGQHANYCNVQPEEAAQPEGASRALSTAVPWPGHSRLCGVWSAVLELGRGVRLGASRRCQPAMWLPQPSLGRRCDCAWLPDIVAWHLWGSRLKRSVRAFSAAILSDAFHPCHQAVFHGFYFAPHRVSGFSVCALLVAQDDLTLPAHRPTAPSWGPCPPQPGSNSRSWGFPACLHFGVDAQRRASNIRSKFWCRSSYPGRYGAS